MACATRWIRSCGGECEACASPLSLRSACGLKAQHAPAHCRWATRWLTAGTRSHFLCRPTIALRTPAGSGARRWLGRETGRSKRVRRALTSSTSVCRPAGAARRGIFGWAGACFWPCATGSPTSCTSSNRRGRPDWPGCFCLSSFILYPWSWIPTTGKVRAAGMTTRAPVILQHSAASSPGRNAMASRTPTRGRLPANASATALLRSAPRRIVSTFYIMVFRSSPHQQSKISN